MSHAYPVSAQGDLAMKVRVIGWAVFAPFRTMSWRSLETSREATLRAFAGEHWAETWPANEAAGYRCVPVYASEEPNG